MTLGKNFRLPQHVLPRAYRASLTLDLDKDSFVGEAEIDLVLSEPSSVIHLHSIGLDVAKAAVKSSETAPVVTVDAESETVTLTWPTPIDVGATTLSISWSGRFSPGLRGLYRAGTVALRAALIPIAATENEVNSLVAS